MNISTRTSIEEILNHLQFNITTSDARKIESYIDILFKWHERKNLISTRNKEYFLQRDLYDCLCLISHIPEGDSLDIGTGAGLPGLILSIFRPNDSISLIDRRENAIRFLEHVKVKLKLENINIFKQDIDKMKITIAPKSILIKNFSNKKISKLDFQSRVEYFVNLFRKKLNCRAPIIILTGSNVLSFSIDDLCGILNIKIDASIKKINTPFFDTNRFILELS